MTNDLFHVEVPYALNVIKAYEITRVKFKLAIVTEFKLSSVSPTEDPLDKDQLSGLNSSLSAFDPMIDVRNGSLSADYFDWDQFWKDFWKVGGPGGWITGIIIIIVVVVVLYFISRFGGFIVF
ncbi:MAG: hypothetical protein ACTSVI_04970 [Promethearchaeota archaeon]